MSRVRIKNFGPIKEGNIDNDGWIDIEKVTIFIGNQGSGKSTVAKVISTLTWIEKALNRGDIEIQTINDFQRYFKYQRLEDYFREETIIEYVGKRFSITHDIKKIGDIVKPIDHPNYIVPKIMYIPAERNFLTTVRNAYDVKGLPDTLVEFAEELKHAQIKTTGKEIKLPIKGYKYKYDDNKQESYVVGIDHEINLLAASSGFQSSIPLYLVSDNLANIISNGNDSFSENFSVSQRLKMNSEISQIMIDDNIEDAQKNDAVKNIKAKYQNKCFINIVEEPEQNLFPSSQRHVFNALLTYNNVNIGNKLIITTHSPYIINYVTLAVEANSLLKKINNDDNLIKQLIDVVPKTAAVNSYDLAIYQFDEQRGIIEKLDNYKGLPSDKNYLNESLEESNELFSRLLDIEDLCK